MFSNIIGNDIDFGQHVLQKLETLLETVCIENELNDLLPTLRYQKATVKLFIRFSIETKFFLAFTQLILSAMGGRGWAE